MTLHRAQGSTEYLVIAAVVLVIALAAMGFLGFWPGFGADARKTQSDVYWRSANPIGIIDYIKQGEVLTLVLFNNDAQGSVTVKEVKVNGDNFLQAPVKINSGSTAKVSLVLPTAENCSDSNPSFEYKISFKYTTQDSTEYAQEGVAPLIGRCSSNEMPSSLCRMCIAPANELCCEPAACRLAPPFECGMCGNAAVDAGENCENCGGEFGDVKCAEGQNCVEGECVGCVGTGQYGCSSPTDCCAELATCNGRGVCVDNSAGECGDDICNNGETCSSCPADCGACPYDCGDTYCATAAGETCSNCQTDCGVCPFCEDGNCMPPADTCVTCSQDCGACEPNDPMGTCRNNQQDEACTSCPADYPEGTCPSGFSCDGPGEQGDGTCDVGETAESCPADCSPSTCSGGEDGICSPDSCTSCPSDCNPCSPTGCSLFDGDTCYSTPANPSGGCCDPYDCISETCQ